MKVAVFIFAAVAVFAQSSGTFRCVDTPAGDCVEVKPKPVDPAAAAVFWKARHDMLAARLAVIENNAKASEALAKITCAVGYQLAESQSPLGLECVPKPKEEQKK